MVLRVWTMVEANLRSSSRSRMSAIEWKMFSAFSRRQSCLEDRHKTRVTETRASTQKPIPWPRVLRKQGPYWAWCGTPAPRPVRGHRDSQWPGSMLTLGQQLRSPTGCVHTPTLPQFRKWNSERHSGPLATNLSREPRVTTKLPTRPTWAKVHVPTSSWLSSPGERLPSCDM